MFFKPFTLLAGMVRDQTLLCQIKSQSSPKGMNYTVYIKPFRGFFSVFLKIELVKLNLNQFFFLVILKKKACGLLERKNVTRNHNSLAKYSFNY